MQSPPSIKRARILVQGAVQGVGFRPYVYRLASELNLCGWVLNSAEGVVIEVEGAEEVVQCFVDRLTGETPPRATVHHVGVNCLEAAGYRRFEIRYSDDTGDKNVVISPDIATCADCLRELFDGNDRRFRYPFTNCTNCGPRFTMIESLPYDRPRTTMKGFTMCARCEEEYRNPLDRRFHAQPNACPECGPQIALWNAGGGLLAVKDEALMAAAERVRNGEVLALKGMGGFQLIVDAGHEAAVRRLRARKHREEKPFALMVPSLERAREICEIGVLEERLLCSPEAPIVLLPSLSHVGAGAAFMAPSVAPGSPYLGVMLPYTPLHHLLMRELGFPVVATSGNLSDEPICIDEHEALERLRGIADTFLVHDRPIARHMDDSVVRPMCGRLLVLRRARGYAPLPVRVAQSLPAMMAVGAHLKNAVALSQGTNIFLSQHVGNLETKQAYSAFCKAASDLPHLYDATIERIVGDLHPDYLSTKYAAHSPFPVDFIQHHWAHVAACMAENGLVPPALGIAWDGTGFGTDGTIWGGEFLLADGGSFRRVAHWRPFGLPGGEAAIKEPRRCALGVLHEIFGDELWERRDLLSAFSRKEAAWLRKMFENGVNLPKTSSVGRLFDAVAALAGLRDRVSFEGQAAMELEAAVDPDVEEAYPFEVREKEVLDWERTVLAIIRDRQDGLCPGRIAAKFHNMLAEAAVAVARIVGEPRIVLTGGCFQNKLLTEQMVRRLSQEGFLPYWHKDVPPNDGGIALGQIVAAAWMQRGFSFGRPEDTRRQWGSFD